MKIFLLYLKEKIKKIGLFILFLGIFPVSLLLYRLPLPAVVYPTLLCALGGTGYLLWDFFRVREKHRKLRRIQNLTDCLTEALPEAETIGERDYQQIIALLCEEQTALATKMDLRYEDMMDYYTAWVHQIKTPIASLRLTLQNEDSHLGRKVNSELLRIEQYVQMVLMFLRLDSDSSDYVLQTCALDDIVRPAVRRFAGEFIDRKLQLSYAPLNTEVLTDGKWMSFVVEQVLSNALKYTSQGSVSIAMESSWVLAIRDTGMGIADEDLPRIFEKGYTGYNGRSDKKATGIGLYLCRRICRNLGHRIWAESRENGGTAIYIDFFQEKLAVE